MKKIFFLASLFMLFLFVGCGGSDSGNLPDFTENEETGSQSNGDYIILAYVWSNPQNKPEREVMPDPNVLTHINYGFGNVNKSFDGIVIQRPERLLQIAGLKKQNPNLKICLSIGGYGKDSEGFSQMARDPEKRKSFALDCKRVLDEFGIDGIDIDWEYPTKSPNGLTSHPDDTKNYTLMMRDIRKTIGKDKLLTLASSASAECFDFQNLLPIVDYVNVMAYDMDVPPHHHSALYQSEHTGSFWANEAITLHKLAGFPLSKMVLGVPFYGHIDIPAMKGMVDYKVLVTISGYTECWDDLAKVPYWTDYTGKFVCTYDNAKSLGYKCKFVKENGLKGVMYWRYDADDTKGTLRKAVYNGMMGK